MTAETGKNVTEMSTSEKEFYFFQWVYGVNNSDGSRIFGWNTNRIFCQFFSWQEKYLVWQAHLPVSATD